MDLIGEQAKKIALLIDSKKGADITLLDVQGISSITDFLLITTGTSVRQVLALADYVDDGAEALGLTLRHKEGHHTGDWVILDFADVVVHIFVRETRDYYGLERMWRDARTVELELDTEMKAL